jgi:2-desacetyl-2-hydroxyethyl bacteriochlorophyllide A dehydrogenase
VAAAVWFPRPRAVELRDEPVRDPGAHEVRVRAVLSGLSHGTERLVYRGEVDPSLPLDLPSLAGGYGFPVKYGYASAGRVVASGREVESAREGDLVFALHPHQDEYVVDASLVRRIPDGVTADRAIFLANLDTAVNIVLDAKANLGETVAVFGQGVVGLLVTQLLVRSGARVIAVEPAPLRRAAATRSGTHTAIAPSEVALITALTEGRGADIAIEASGNGAALQPAIDAVAIEGTVVVSSWYGEKRVTLDLGGHFHRGRVRVVSSQVGRIDPSLAPRWDRARRLGVATSLLRELELPSLISHRIPFAQAAEAYALLDERPDETIQVVLEYA